MMKNMKDSFAKIADVLKSASKVFIVAHHSMDGDAVGSCGALCSALRRLNVDATVVTEDDVPSGFHFLMGDMFRSYTELAGEKADVCVCLDCGETNRFPKRAHLFEEADTRICIDHHPSSEGIGDYNHIDPTAAATAELVYDLLVAMGNEFDEQQALMIYTALATDSGNFMYSNTTVKTHLVAAEMLKTGINTNTINVEVYESESPAKIKLHADVLAKSEFLAGGAGMIAAVSQNDVKKCHASMDDTEGLVATMRSIAGVEMAALIKEKEANVIKVSMRAKNYCDVSAIAQRHGGGGHVKAAGFTYYGSLEEACRIVREDGEKALKTK